MKVRTDYHTIVIGGGCLGCASAISVQRRLLRDGDDESSVCILEKNLVGSGLTARHSGIVRSANAVPVAARLAKIAADQWHSLENLWGVAASFDACGAIWIARDNGQGGNAKWDSLEQRMREMSIDFHKVDASDARAVLPHFVKLYDDELYYLEPGALQFDPTTFRNVLYKALEQNSVQMREKTEVVAFERNEDGSIAAVLTKDGDRLACSHVVNAAGPWSPAIFAPIGLSVPVSAEPVCVVNWLTSYSDIESVFPIIADYINLAYFRLWRDNEIHMHQPRKRVLRETARAFAESPLSVVGADFVNDPTNQGLGYSQIRVYEEISRHRFDNIGQSVYGSGYKSYFDITPDLKFILGPDHRVSNLVHCLGAGQAFKYTPVFGEIVADFVCGGENYAPLAAEFSIARFDQAYMNDFWERVSGIDNSLEAEAEASAL
ncbi:NAD(P)/FAD-dependent oxidoreductase [Methyloceanibacter sp.]|uniref:NAD(P)/FAD-dependent oxidoreductase n=1 Tax=Methyloceanibacter sp. TaxID=1965321 RepID=UPI003567DE17